jgi:hypothetical protein
MNYLKKLGRNGEWAKHLRRFGKKMANKKTRLKKNYRVEFDKDSFKTTTIEL